MEAPAHTTQAWHFGVFEVDAQRKELRRAGIPIKLREQSFRVLVSLLENPGELVAREDLRKALWPADTYVDFDHSLNTAVMKLREALGDTAEKPLYIETIPKRGYRFIAPTAAVGEIRDDSVGPRRVDGLHFAAGAVVQPAKRATRGPFKRGVAWWAGGLVAVAAISFLLFALRFESLHRRVFGPSTSNESSGSVRIDSIAVLPLENLSGDMEQEYFADGLTDCLISDLGQVSGLRVISHLSVLRYKKSKIPLAQIARELSVGAVVEGTVQRAGNRVQINVQLLDAKADRHLWAQSYERELGDVLGLEKSMALAIAHEVYGGLNPGVERRLGNPRSVKAEAYDAYLRGRHLLDLRTPEEESDARGYFELAIRTDPHFALPYSGLADYLSIGWSGPSDVELAEKYARQAVALDPELAEGHASMGVIAVGKRHFSEGERELKKAIELNASYTMAHHWYAIVLMSMGHSKEALAENEQARQLSPFSFPVNFVRGIMLFHLREDELAIEQTRKSAMISPHSAAPFIGIARIYWLEGKVPEALANERTVANMTHDDMLLSDANRALAVYKRAGVHAAQLSWARKREKAYMLEDRAGIQPRPDPCQIAAYYAVAGDREKALRWLEKASGEPGLSAFVEEAMGAPEFNFMRSDPRFTHLLHRTGMTD